MKRLEGRGGARLVQLARTYALGVARGGASGALAVVGLAVAIVESIAIVTSLFVVGALVVPSSTRLLHRVATWGRGLGSRQLGEPIVGRPAPLRERTFAGRAQEIITEASTWRELGWAWLHTLAGLVQFVTCLVPGLAGVTGRLSARLARRLLGYGLVPGSVASGSGGAPSGPGHGLIGMRERVEVLGGHIEVGRTPEGGFAVRVALPLPPPDDTVLSDDTVSFDDTVSPDDFVPLDDTAPSSGDDDGGESR